MMSLEELTLQNSGSLLQRARDFLRRNLLGQVMGLSLALLPASCHYADVNKDTVNDSIVVTEGNETRTDYLTSSGCNLVQLCHLDRSTLRVGYAIANNHLSHGDYLGNCQPDSDGDGYSRKRGDCDDSNNAINPAALEICDGVDNNCNGVIDDGLLSTFYQDSDGDGIGNTSEAVQACTAPVRYVADMSTCAIGDCDDTNASLWQNVLAYVDSDADGFGAGTVVAVCAGASLPAGYALNTVDCDDTNATINPTVEVCDGLDNDCDGLVDEENVCPITI